MSQKSILSFFKQTDNSQKNESVKSPVKKESTVNGEINSSKRTNEKSTSIKHNGDTQSEDVAATGSSKSPKSPKEIKNSSSKSSKSKKSSVHEEIDSPIKKSKRKTRQIIDSDEESNEAGPANTAEKNVEDMDVDNNLVNESETEEKVEKQKNKSTKRTPARKRKKEPQTDSSPPKKAKLSTSSVDSESEVKKELQNGIDESSEAPAAEEEHCVPTRKTVDVKSPLKEVRSPQEQNKTATPNKRHKIDGPNKIYKKKDSEIKSEPKVNLEVSEEVQPKAGEKDNHEDSAVNKKSQAIHPFFSSKNKTKEDNISIKKEVPDNDQKDTKDSIEEADSTSDSSKVSKNKDLASSTDVQSENTPKKKINTSSTSSGVIYDPSKSKYHPINDACWKHKEKVPYLALAKTLQLIENTSARLKNIEILSNFLRSVIVLTPEDLLQCVYLCLNRIAPEYEGIELGVGDMLLMKAVAQATGRTLDKIRAEVKEKGDLGLVAESSRGNQKVMFAPPKLTVASVFSKFKEIAKMSGNAAMAKKTDKIQVLFVACRDCEARYIIRSLSGKLRIGMAEQSVLAAISRAIVLTPTGQSYPPEIIDKSSGMSTDRFKKLLDEKTLILKTTYCECPNYDLVIPVLLKEGIDGLPKHCQLSPGCPLKPMLAHPTTGIAEVLRRFDNNEFTCEFKYDGERAQIHRTDKGEVKIFSRNQEDNTSKYPDVIARITKALKDSTKSFILDTEAVAWDRESKQILPFQVLSTRKKKDAVETEIVVQVCVMAFDLLYLNGESLVKKPLKERRKLLHESFEEVENEFNFVTYKDGNSAETMQEFLDDSVKGNCEGLMVKALEVDASYEIAKRSHNWLKLKKDYLEGVGDTLDLVVIGGYHGKGKRTGNYGGFLLACYDEDNEEFQSICKLGTGFKEDELEAHTKFLKEHIIDEAKSYYRFDSGLKPDEWFDAVQVWEIKCADLSISPIHKAAAGIVDPEKGISLRFPRFIRIRDDKKPEEASPSSLIAERYQNQEQVQNMKSKQRNEEDFY